MENEFRAVADCASLEEVRAHIDRLDRQIVALLAERGGYVKQAARFKKSTDDVKAPARVEQVIAKVTGLAQELGADAVVVEKVYRAMIAGFIEAELREHAGLASGASKA
ncbi:chorismate mutase [Azohydromonas sp. G-1-1-14]|uniref:chorismate mutase n=2 Tax=Azohydromonas caseinilytica TaxID=2728836 RepID=A0A848F8D1_9BURK|nr:chorismate mutase [Azohydromonas caseinilytica]